MGGGPSREEADAQAAVEEQQLRNEEAKRGEDSRRLDEMMKDAAYERTNARKVENERAAEEQKRADELRMKITNQHAEARAREQQREEAAQAANSEQAQRAVETNTQLMNALSNMNQQAVATANTNHQSGLRDTMTKISQEEKDTRGRVLELTAQKEKKQDELHKEKEAYSDKKRAEVKDHQDRVLAVEQSKIEIIREQTAIKENHASKMFCIKEAFAVQKNQIQLASEFDRKEINLIDAVHNVRQAGNQLSNHTVQFSSVEYLLSKQLPIPNRAKKATITACNRSYDCLQVLAENASAILEQPESRHPKTTECQSVARGISELAAQLSKHLTTLQGYGDDLEPESMRSVWTDITTCCQDLNSKVIELPVVSKSDYAIEAISASVKALTGKSIGILEPKETGQQKKLED